MAANQAEMEIIQDTVSKPFCRLDLPALFRENSSCFTQGNSKQAAFGLPEPLQTLLLLWRE